MPLSDTAILIVFILVCVVGFVPAVKNFLVVLREKDNPNVGPHRRKFLLAYLALGGLCIVFMFIFSIYSFVARSK